MKTLLACLVLLAAGCAMVGIGTSYKDGTFGSDVQFLKKHMPVIVLSDDKGDARVAVSPGLQGRVMTSTAGGNEGQSFGWINRELIESKKVDPHFNPVGGEERFWMGPEGGQFSIFFAEGKPFNLTHWYVPPSIDTEPFETVKQEKDRASFQRRVTLTNYSGTVLQVLVNREIRLLAPTDAWRHLGVAPAADAKLVAFESVNRITNAGKEPWTKERGLLSIWILCMFNPSPATTVVVPVNPGPAGTLGKIVTDDYFGTVPEDRLILKDRAVYFSADGKCRSKIGFNQKRARGILGSYDAANRVLTLAQYTHPKEPMEYVNSKWEIQKNPYVGDTVNSYNDGPTTPGGKPLGPFYEIESSSPAAALAPGESLEHVHRTIHVQGTEAALDRIAKATLGVTLQEIVTAIPKP